jgi:Flp pilus assembly protein TadG
MKLIKKFLNSDNGAFTAIFAVMMPVLIAGVGLAVDVGFWYSSKRDLQNAADAGALAGGYEFIRTNSQGFATTEANSVAAKNVDGPSQVTTTFPVANRIQVTVQAAAGTFFLGSFISSPPVVRATALAEFTEGETKPPACLNLLAPDGESLRINGNGRVEMGDGCGVQVNSGDDGAVNINGEGRLISDDVCVNGGVAVQGPNSISSVPKIGCPPISNPYEHLEFNLQFFDDNCSDRPVERGGIVRTRFGEVSNFSFGPSATRNMLLTIQNGVRVSLSGGSGGFPLIVRAVGNLNISEPDAEIDLFRGLSIISSETERVTHEITGGGNITVAPGRGISVPGSEIDINGNSGIVSDSVSITARSLRVGGNTTVRIGQNPAAQPIQSRPGEVGGVQLIN